MKNLKFLVIALTLIIGVSSCKKEDNGNNINSTSILGKWYLKKRVTNNFVNGVSSGENISSNFTIKDYTEFKTDGIGLNGDDGQEYPFTYKLTNEGKNLTFTEDGDTDSYTISTITDTELILYMESVYNQDGIVNKYTEELTLKR